MIDVKKYYEIVNPKSAFEIIEKEVLEPLLNGYSYALKSGISFVCPKNSNYENKNDYRIGAFNGKAPDTFQGVCSYWRSPNGCNMDEVCIECENKEASLHFNQNRDYLRIYRCNPLSLWKLTYPILINDRVIAVMFAGQIIVKGEINWKSELKEFTKYIDSNCLIQPENQVKSIEKQVSKNDIEQEKKENLINILSNKDPINDDYKMIQNDIEGFRDRIRNFVRFGEQTQKLISLLYNQRRESGERELINEFSEEYDDLQFIGQHKYWNDFEEKIRTLKELPFIDDIKVFTRDRSKYIQQNIVPKGIILFAGDVISNLHLNQIINIDFSKIENSLNRIKSNTYNVYGFRSDKGNNNELCSTLIIITGNIPSYYDGFIKKICDISCNFSNLALMIYRERNTMDDYQKQVKNIGHSFSLNYS